MYTLTSSYVEFPGALKAFIAIVGEGGCEWAKNFPDILRENSEVGLVEAHVHARNKAWETACGYNGPRIPTLKIGDHVKVHYETCLHTEIMLEGSFQFGGPVSWQITVEGAEISVLRRALAAPEDFPIGMVREDMRERFEELRGPLDVAPATSY